MRNKTAVIGLGNLLLSDEGAGLHALHFLRKKLTGDTGGIKNILDYGEEEIPETDLGVDLVEAGTPGMNLLHQFDEREKIIFVDAGNCGLNPGEFRRFTPDEVFSLKKKAGYSLHEFDLIKFIEFARNMGLAGNVELVIYCIQASEVRMSEELSPIVRENLPYLVDDLFNEINRGR